MPSSRGTLGRAAAIVIASVRLVIGQEIDPEVGKVQPIDLTGGSATVTLDFTERDYELILYSAVTDPADTASTYAFTVSGPDVVAKPIALRSGPNLQPTSDRQRLEEELRRRERALARRIRAAGWKPSAPKVQPTQAATRTFVFEAFGNVTQDQTVASTLVASNDLVAAYLDDAPASQGTFTSQQIQDMIDTFRDVSHPAVTGVFGAPSDVDGDGRIVFLYTHLVDQVGGVSGFFASSSVVPESQGGDGNLTDMMYIGLASNTDFYKPLLAHEFQHLINFNQHALVREGLGEDSWLNEGLSHYAEDLVDSHVAGDLPRLYVPYFGSPESFSLIGPAGLNNGIRGAAYLFVRTLTEDFGPAIAGDLVQTELSGTENVANATAFDFLELYGDHVSRLFLSGTGLNESRIYNYTFSYFTEPITGKRSLPNPHEAGVPASGAPVTGGVHPLSATFLRLMGTNGTETITIDTDLPGDFRGLLIPIPQEYHPDRELRADYFPALTFDASIPGLYTTAQPEHFSGQVSGTDITQLLFKFLSTDGAGREIEFATSFIDGDFSEFIIFTEDQVGAYDLEIYGGTFGEPVPFIGRFPVEVLLGSGPVLLPQAFFDGLSMDEVFETVIPVGSARSFKGSVTDPAISEVQLQFDPIGINEDLIIRTAVRSDGTFRRGFVFSPDTEGEYSATVFAFDANGDATNLGDYSPIAVTEAESNRVHLPVDFFQDILLDEPLFTMFFRGQDLEISGRMLDSQLNQVGILLNDEFGQPALDERVTTTGDAFTISFTVPIIDPGEDFEVLFIAGTEGGSLFGKGSYGAAQLVESKPDLLLLSESLTFSETAVGSSTEQTLAIDNVGSEPLILSDYVFTGPFSTASGTLTIQPGERGSIAILFQPVTTGDTTGTFVFDANDPDRQAVQVDLAGGGTPQPLPVMSVLQQAVAWGQVEVGASLTRVIRVTNTGNADLIVTQIAADVPNFIVNASAATIAPGDTLLVPVVFEPDAGGTVVGALQITGNDLQNPTVSVILTGVGTSSASDPGFAVLDTQLVWGSVEVGQSESQDLGIANLGSDTVTVTVQEISGDFRADFESIAIAPGDTLLALFSFTPTETGERTGTLTLATTDPGQSTIELSASGTGIVIQTEAPSPDFNRDGRVNFPDFLELVGVFNSRLGDGVYDAAFDLTQDGAINFNDFLEFASAFGDFVDTAAKPAN